MKRWLVFLLGFIAGIAFTFICVLIIAKSNADSKPDGMTFFEQPTQCFTGENYVVFQTIEGKYALAYEEGYYNDYSYINHKLHKFKRSRRTGVIVLIANDNGEYYYDKQEIPVPKGLCMRQVGVYNYLNKDNISKTVPIVKLMNK